MIVTDIRETAMAAEAGGATAVSIGTANFREPYTTVKTIVGIEKYMERHGIEDIHEIIGCVE